MTLIFLTEALNTTENLAPVCPNCHMILHAKEDGAYTVEEVPKFIVTNVRFVAMA